MNKNQLILEDYDIFDTELLVYFSVNQELEVRESKVDIDIFDKWLDDNGLYEMSEDCWDYATESHYTKDWTIGLDEYISEYITSSDVIDFIYEYYQNKPLPEFVEV
jgi:hypothetical protein